MNTNREQPARKHLVRNLIVAIPVLVLVGITTLSGNQGTPATVDATMVASGSPAAMTGATLSEMHALIPPSNDEPETVPTF